MCIRDSNKEESAQVFIREDQEVMSAVVPIVDKENKDEVLGTVVVTAYINDIAILEIVSL